MMLIFVPFFLEIPKSEILAIPSSSTKTMNYFNDENKY